MLCELTGRTPATIRVAFHSKRLDMRTSVLVSDETFRMVHRCGGLDSFLLQQGKEHLTKKAWRLRQEIRYS